MGSTLPLFPEQASNFASRCGPLVLLLRRGHGLLLGGHFRCRSSTSPSATGGAPIPNCLWRRTRRHAARDRLERDSVRHHHGHVRVGREHLLQREPPAGRRHADLRGRQAVDVEARSIMEGQREINELHIPLGRAVKLTMTSEDVIHSFFRAGVPHQAGRGAGPLYHHLVHADQAGQVSSVLRRVLRHQAFRHDRLGLRDGARQNIRNG